MPKTLEETRAFLEKQEGGAEYVEAIVSSIEAEKQRGILESQKSNKEAQNLRKFKIALEGLGFNQEEHQLEDFITTLKTSKEEASESKKTKTTLESISKDFENLKKNFDASQLELAKERKLAQELKQKNINSKLKEVLSLKLGQTIYGADLIIDSLITTGKVSVDENENPIFKDGEKIITIDDGVKQFIEARPDLVKNKQNPGASSQPNNNQAPDPNSDGERLKKLRTLGSTIVR